jgi:uncharacterized membrane-anchored protein YitT (DUF2179 family)
VKRAARESLNGLLILLGILSASMGIHGFLLSSHFIDGGVTGISMLMSTVTGVALASGCAGRHGQAPGLH